MIAHLCLLLPDPELSTLFAVLKSSQRPSEVDTVMLNGMGFKKSVSEVKSDPLTYQLCDRGLLFNSWPQFLIHEMRIILFGVVGKIMLKEMNLKH